jgi:uroporphyrinogen-III synthase
MSNLPDEKTYALFDTPPNQKLISVLFERGSKTILFPTIETEKVDLSSESNVLLKNLTNFDWIIFPDVYTVEFFLQNLEECGIDLFELDAVNVCVFGEAIADKLRFVQLHADVISDANDGDEVFQTLSNYLNDQLQNLKFILAKEISLEYEIKNKLINCGGTVEELSVYAAKISNKSEIVKAKTLLKGGAIDEFVFSSDEDLIALRHYFANEAIANVLADVRISAFSQTIFQTLKENKLRPLYFHLGKE